MKVRKIWGVFIVVAALHCGCYASGTDNIMVDNTHYAKISDTNAYSNQVLSDDVSHTNMSGDDVSGVNAYCIDVNSVNKNGDTPLLLAVKASKNFKLGIVETLLNNGADVNIKDSRGFTPLECVLLDSYAYSKYSNDVVKLHVSKLLLDAGAIVDTTTTNGMKVADKIITSGKIDVITAMLKNNKNIEDIIKSTDCNWLTTAITIQDKNLVEFLLEKGANMNVTDDHGNTPLHSAVSTGSWEIVKLFFSSANQQK